MNNDKDSRMLVYVSLMALVLSCIVLGYSLVFFGFGPKNSLHGISISPGVIIVAGLIIAAINGFASNVLSDQFGEKINSLKGPLRLGIPLIAFLATLALSILIALMSS